MKNMRILGFAGAMMLAALPWTVHAGGAPITVHIRNLPSDSGMVFIMLCTREAYAAKGRGCVRTKVPPADGEAHYVFEDVAPGEYVVQAVHDANNNGKVDTRWYGKPKEAYGMSMNPRSRFGRPKFDDGAFTHTDEPQTLDIVMRGGKRRRK